LKHNFFLLYTTNFPFLKHNLKLLNISKPVNETNLNFYNYSGRWVHKNISLPPHKQATLERSNFLFIFLISNIWWNLWKKKN
jgi:hypothetical protein